MAFAKDRTGWKKQGPRITAKLYDQIIAALRETPDDIEGIAARFDLSQEKIRRLAPRVGRPRSL